jgi:hypothetical protein
MGRAHSGYRSVELGVWAASPACARPKNSREPFVPTEPPYRCIAIANALHIKETGGMFDKLLTIRKALALCALLGIVSGCAVKPLSPTEFNAKHQGTGHTLVTQAAPDFQFQTFTNKYFVSGIAGMLLSRYQGGDLVNTYRLEDPSLILSQALSSMLSKDYASKMSSAVVLDKYQHPVVRDLAHAADSKGLALFVRTTDWSLTPHNNPGYTFFYQAQARLVDAQNMKELANIHCYFTNEDDGVKLPTESDYLGDAAYLLKQLTMKATEHCRQYFMENLLPNQRLRARLHKPLRIGSPPCHRLEALLHRQNSLQTMPA